MRLARKLPKLHPAKAQRVADLPLREALAAIAGDCWPLPAVEGFNNSLSDEWYTPEEWIERACTVMGSIDTDPATTEAVNKKFIRAPIFCTIDSNGLDEANRWKGNVWLNPPYSKAGAFIKRLGQELDAGNVKPIPWSEAKRMIFRDDDDSALD